MAVAAYNAQNGVNPGAVVVAADGTTSGDGVAELVGPYLKSWPDNNGANYQISFDGNNINVTVGGVLQPAAGGFTADSCVGASN